jgi:hypothetical protein
MVEPHPAGSAATVLSASFHFSMKFLKISLTVSTVALSMVHCFWSAASILPMMVVRDYLKASILKRPTFFYP